MTPDIQFDNYRPGIFGNIVMLHGKYYAKHWNFGSYFEAQVAAGLADFSSRMAAPNCALISAWKDDIFLGSISVDNDGEPKAQSAHLRWYIMSDQARGKKIGRPLFDKAISFIRANGYKAAYLTTFKGLEAATRIYTDNGFVLTHEEQGDNWGTTVTEQRYDLVL
jgi:GNAT superfamily N-acetyltransferase